MRILVIQSLRYFQRSAFSHSTMFGEPAVKKLASEIKIGTHNGTFHCDEVLACFMLKQLSEFKSAAIIRSRTPNVLEECDIVVDVGGVYNAAKHRYDHHQSDFKETMNSLNSSYPWVTKLSSAGLVYYHFGERIIAHMIDKAVGSDEVKLFYRKLYESFMEEIDAIDNGIPQNDMEMRYRITTNLSARVGYLNPKWNEKDKNSDKLFSEAMKMVGTEFTDRLNFYAKVWWPARGIVLKAIEGRHKTDTSGEIIEFESGGCPWTEHLFTLENEMSVKPLIKFVLYPDENKTWRIQCVPVRVGSFENRLSLPVDWRGIRDDKLSAVSGISDCVFVHSNGFIGGNKTRNGVLEMAKKTLQLSKHTGEKK